MKQLCFLAVLMLLGSSAPAGAISFKIGGHRVHIESSRHCRSMSCASISVSRSLNWRHKRDRHDDDRNGTVPGKPAPQTVSPPAPPEAIAAAPPPAVYTPAASTTQIVAAPPPPPPPALPPAPQASIPSPPPPPAKPVETEQPAQVERVSRQAEEEPSDSPIGDWQTEGKGRVRIAKCGNALCGYVLNSSNEKGEAILINMKPKTERQWTGGVHSQNSGATYYGTMSMEGGNTLRVEACALFRFYCSGNNWSRITRRADGLAMVSAEPRS